jgi:two-component system cell cycle sensor histidine kinase PleC
MRSTEQSGVGTDGFNFAHGHRPVPRARLRVLFEQAFVAISPVTIAVVATALVAASLFVIFDYARTLEDLARRDAVVERMATAQPLLARQFATGSLDPLIGETNRTTAMLGVAGRGAIAFGLVLLAGGLSFRPYRSASHAGPVRAG